LDQDTFIQGIHRIHEHIRAGDIYQVNLTRLASVEVAVEPRRLFARLQRTCPAPCTSYLELPSRTILSASPELFLRSVPGPEGLGITTQPIKGSSPRHPDPVRDQAIRRALEQNAKERAELIMITDLERNDLGQVCQFGSVHVEELCAPRTFSHVHHLVSTVTGTARPEETPLSVLTALFPGGSITGAPKKRAREIIAELEPGPRGLYTGAIGFFAHNQISQWSIAIRTLEHVGHRIRYGVGSGITIGSDPEQEWTETQIKEAGLLETLFDLRHDAGER
jgi:anthranilate/para-aminobenzoate synthase component I